MAPAYDQGTYRVGIVRQGFTEGEFGLQFVLTVMPLGCSNKYDRTVYLSLTDADGQRAEYADKTIDVLRYLGFHGSQAELARLDPEHANHRSFVGIECEAYCQHKTKDDGSVVERWYINTPRSGGVEYSTPKATVLKKLDSLFGKELKEAPVTTVQDSPLPATSAPPLDAKDSAAIAVETKGQDDSIPF